MFRGRFVHTIDSKGRLSIAAGFRTQLQRGSKAAPILTNLVDCLALYRHEDWVRIEKRICAASPIQPDVQALQRFMISGAVECPIDAQGRILIPPYLRQHAMLEKEATIAGVGPRIEIWNKVRLDLELEATRRRFNEISSKVAELGG